MSKGKCFSCVNQGQRNPRDFYKTPYSLTEQLLSHEYFDFSKSVLEPAAGDGSITKVLNKHFNTVYFGDIETGEDFLDLNSNLNSDIDYIITNPPFSKAMEFILKAKSIAKDKFAMLLPLDYLHGQKRFNTLYKNKNLYIHKKREHKELIKIHDRVGNFEKYLDDDELLKNLKFNRWKDTYDLSQGPDYGLEKIYIFTRFIMFSDKPLREDGKYETGMKVFAWYVWNNGFGGDPTIKWIDNNEYVLRKNK